MIEKLDRDSSNNFVDSFMTKIKQILFVLLLTIIGFINTSEAQEKRFQFSVGGGLGFPIWLRDVKKPDYSARLWLEKNVESEKINTVWFAAEYTYLPAAGTKTFQFDPTGPNSTVTYTYHPSMLATLTMGWRKWSENGFVRGIGGGLGVYSQGLPFRDYSDNILDYEQTEKNDFGWGPACVGHIGYKKGKSQVLATVQSAVSPFDTFVVGFDDGRSSVVLVFGLSAVFSL